MPQFIRKKNALFARLRRDTREMILTFREEIQTARDSFFLFFLNAIKKLISKFRVMSREEEKSIEKMTQRQIIRRIDTPLKRRVRKWRNHLTPIDRFINQFSRARLFWAKKKIEWFFIGWVTLPAFFFLLSAGRRREAWGEEMNAFHSHHSSFPSAFEARNSFPFSLKYFAARRGPFIDQKLF